jgi:hypothetical protein
MGPDRLAWGHAFGMVGVSDRDPRSFSLTVYAASMAPLDAHAP